MDLSRLLKPGQPRCTSSLVICGGTGDLARRKLIPALCRLAAGQAISSDLHVIITGRKALSPPQLRASLEEAVRANGDPLTISGFATLAGSFHYLVLDPADPRTRETLPSALDQIEGLGAAPARLFYLAVPPEQIAGFIEAMEPVLARDRDLHCPSRILVEKPFGNDLASAQALNQLLHRHLHEDQILRIDHYLGKEAVQNILVLRFANILFEPVWNNRFIDHVQISFAEKIGVERRAAYFDRSGILRDVVQNHLLQVLCLTAMEPPLSHHPDHVRIEKKKVLGALRPIAPAESPHQTCRGRYGPRNREGATPLPGYLQEQGVPSDSCTETFAALRVFLDTWRWSGVPFYLRAGKRLSASKTEIAVFFKEAPINIFPPSAGVIVPNVLVMEVQPNEGIRLSLHSKAPGMSLKLATVEMDFSYQHSFGGFRPDAYERLLLDALHDESSLFLQHDEIEAAWHFIDPIRTGWEMENPQPLHEYEAGSEGPDAAEELLRADGRTWRQLAPSPPSRET